MVDAKKVHFYLTGFGPFGSITDNPSKTLVKSLTDKYTANPAATWVIADSREVPVTTAEAEKAVNGVFENVEEEKASNPNAVQVILHFGVAASFTEINLELMGYNKADFSIPDSSGQTLRNTTIVPDMELDESINTLLKPAEYVEALTSKKHKVKTSTDPGRYLCNYIYFKSLYKSRGKNIPVMFIHIPEFVTIPQEEQVHCIEDALEEIASDILSRQKTFLLMLHPTFFQ